jgi:hypothetical protein
LGWWLIIGVLDTCQGLETDMKAVGSLQYNNTTFHDRSLHV